MKQSPFPFDLILFDLGGVLVQNQGPARIAHWLTSNESVETILDRWLTSSTVRAFESGQINAEEFSKAIVNEFSIPVNPSEFLKDFSTWVTQYYSGAEDLLKKLSTCYQLGCLSNTNIIHWQYMTSVMNLSSFFDYTFISNEIGLVKPDNEVFVHILDQTRYLPERILFFDDSQRNIDSAQASGIAAFKTEGLAEVVCVLNRLGCEL